MTQQKSDLVKHLTSIKDIDREIIENLFEKAQLFSELASSNSIDKTKFSNKKLGVMFFQNSTRTRLSFESAMLTLGGSVLGFSDPTSTRCNDFFMESLEDVVRVVAQLVDCIVLRHYVNNAAKTASEISSVPVINGGDGSNEHPTQALTDLWTIQRYTKKLDGLKVGIVGKLSVRVIRSLIIGLAYFNIKKFLFLQPHSTNIPDDILAVLKQNKITYQFYQNIDELLKEADVIDLIPINLPDFSSNKHSTDGKKLSTPEEFRLTKEKFLNIGRDVPILHCGPRLDELASDTDSLPQSMYFEQVKNSVYIRMALLDYLLR